MKRARFTEELIIGILQEHEAGAKCPDLCRKHGMSESFIAALALALGLADVVESLSGKIRMDTIFIDEGFGSLDTENGAGTLDQVLQVLAALTEGSRAVGLISHVGLVQEAIPHGFYVRSTSSGSQVEERRGLG